MMLALIAALNAASLAILVSGNAHMSKPSAFLAPESQVPWDQKDYHIDNPLFLNGTNYPCKGYHHSDAVAVSETLKAGEENKLEIDVGDSLGGGTCELSLSYDNGFSFRVFKRFIGGCPVSDYQWTAKYTIRETSVSLDVYEIKKS